MCQNSYDRMLQNVQAFQSIGMTKETVKFITELCDDFTDIDRWVQDGGTRPRAWDVESEGDLKRKEEEIEEAELRAEREREDKDEKIEELQGSVDHLTKERNDLEGQVDDLTAQVEMLEEEIAKLKK